MDSERANFSAEFAILMDDYNDLCDQMHGLTEADIAQFLDKTLPIEDYLKDRYLHGCRDSLWNVSSGDGQKFGESRNIRVHRHFRYDIQKPYKVDFFLLFYVYSGNAQLIIGEEKHEFSLTAGDFVLLTPRTMLCPQVFCDDSIIIKIYIRSSTFERTFYKWIGEGNRFSEIFRRALYDNMSGNCVTFHSYGDRTLRSRVLALYAENFNKDKYSAIIEESILTEIFCRLTRDYLESGQEANDGFGFRDIGTAIKFINDNRADVTLDSLARRIGYSKSYLCRMLMQKTGRTFLQILSAARIDAAKKLLGETDMSISEIAEISGFSNVKQFYRAFRRELDTTSSEYREKSRRDPRI